MARFFLEALNLYIPLRIPSFTDSSSGIALEPPSGGAIEQTSSGALEELSALADRRPEDVAQILNSWLVDEKVPQ